MIKKPLELSGFTPTWCPGCGNWGIVRAIKSALTSLGLGPSDIFVMFDIGCSGNMNDFLNAYSMHTLHGRSVTTAIGAKLGNHSMPTLVVGGDGALYGEGGNHFLHACRGNHDITVIAHDNMLYGLTTGQVAPTTNKFQVTRSTPDGNLDVPVNALALAITQGATFVAQTFIQNSDFTANIIRQAIEHKGFALVNILQPCVTFNSVNTYDYFLKNTYYLPETYNPQSLVSALKVAREIHEEKFALGVVYKNDSLAPYHSQVPALDLDVPAVLQPKIPTAIVQDIVDKYC